MPTLQVINREQDPGQKQMLEASKDIADTIHKSQALKLTAQYYKILAQNAESETDKVKLERMSNLFDKYLPKIQETKDPATKQMYIRALTAKGGLYANDAQTLFGDIHDGHTEVTKNYEAIPGVQQGMQQMKQDEGTATEAQTRGADVGYKNAQIAMMNRQQDMLDKFATGGGQGGDGGMMMSGFSKDGPSFTFPAAKYEEARQASMGTDMGKRQLNQEAFNSAFDSFKATYDLVPWAEPGVGNIGKQAVKNVLSKYDQTSLEGQALKTYQAMVNRLVPLTAHQTDVGNLNKNEQDAAREMFPNPLFDSKPVAEIKFAFLEDLKRLPKSGDPSKVRILLKTYQDRVEAAKNPNTPKSKAIQRLTGQTAAPEAAKKYVRKGTDQATGKRVGMLADGTVEELAGGE